MPPLWTSRPRNPMLSPAPFSRSNNGGSGTFGTVARTSGAVFKIPAAGGKFSLS